MNRYFGGTLDCHGANYNKGKSFRFSEWNSSTLYSNDEYIQDFVSYDGSMYACLISNINVIPSANESHWKLIVSGQAGKDGVTFTPHVDENGNLSWTNDGGLENPEPITLQLASDEDEESTAVTEIYQSDTIAKAYVGSDGYLYLQSASETFPRRVGYVRGDRGRDGREILLRVYSGPSADDDSRIGTHLQWKYAGDEYKLWTNLIQLNELMNVALSGLKLEHEIIYTEGEENIKCDAFYLNSYRVEFDQNGQLVVTDKLATISSIVIPIKPVLKNVKFRADTFSFEFIFETSTGDASLTVSLYDAFEPILTRLTDAEERLTSVEDNVKDIESTIIDIETNIDEIEEDVSEINETLKTLVPEVSDNKIYGRTHGEWVDLTDWLEWAEYD